MGEKKYQISLVAASQHSSYLKLFHSYWSPFDNYNSYPDNMNLNNNNDHGSKIDCQVKRTFKSASWMAAVLVKGLQIPPDLILKRREYYTNYAWLRHPLSTQPMVKGSIGNRTSKCLFKKLEIIEDNGKKDEVPYNKESINRELRCAQKYLVKL